jgi:hypothetical protein
MATPRTARAATVLVTCAALLLVAPTGCAVAPDVPRLDPASGHTWDQTHRVDLPPGWTVTARNVGTVDESTSLSGPGDAGCLVSAWSSRPGRHSRPVSPRTVSLQGHDASYGELDPDYGPYPRAVLWRDAGDRWFGVACDLDEAGVLRVAAGVHAGPNPVRVPFRLRSRVDGARMVQLIESRRDGALTVGALFEATGPGRTPTMEVSSGAAVEPDASPAEREVVGGRLVEVRRRAQSMCLATRTVPVCVVGPNDEPATDWSPTAYQVARRTVEVLEPVEDPVDQAHWYEADDAFPG